MIKSRVIRTMRMMIMVMMMMMMMMMIMMMMMMMMMVVMMMSACRTVSCLKGSAENSFSPVSFSSSANPDSRYR